MSIHNTALVWKKSPYREGTLLLLLALADFSNEEGMCWPSLSALALKSRLSESGVRWSLKLLENDGAIIKLKIGSGKGHTSCYQLSADYVGSKVSVTNTLSNGKGVSRNAKGVSRAMPNKEEPSLKASVKNKCRWCERQTSDSFCSVECLKQFEEIRQRVVRAAGGLG